MSQVYQTPLMYCEQAVEYGRRGQQCHNAQEHQTQLRVLIDQAQDYQTFELKKIEISRLLKGEIDIQKAQTAKNTYVSFCDSNKRLTELMSQWWQNQVELAVKHLRQQSAKLPSQSSPFTQIEPWIGIVILTGQISGQTQDEIDKLIQLANKIGRQAHDEVGDTAAAIAHPEYAMVAVKRDLLAKQIELCEKLRQDLIAPQSALQNCSEVISERPVKGDGGLEKLATRLKNSSQKLSDSASELAKWIEDDLKPFQSELGQTIDLIRSALRQDKFDLVGNAISRAVIERVPPQTPGAPEPGKAFRRFTAHPSFLWLQEFVQEQKNRLLKQKEHKQYIDWGFKLVVETMIQIPDLDKCAEQWKQENSGASNQRDGQVPQIQFDEFIGDLRSSLARGVYPLERIFQRLKEMQTQEPDDECRLQAKLVYQDPETRLRYEGLSQIAPILETKIQQVNQFRQWLVEHGIVDHDATAHQYCPGVADWESAKSKIEADRDTGKLAAALQLCQDLRQGLEIPEKPGVYSTADGLWTLERAHRELGRLPSDLGALNSTVVRTLNAKRTDRITELDRQIKECLAFEADLKKRSGLQKDMQENIWELVGDLNNARASFFWGRTKRIAVAEKELRSAIAKYKDKVCAKDNFINKVQVELG